MNIRQQAERILKYGQPQTINTPLGVRVVRRALANPKFWLFFHEHATAIKQEGLTFRPDQRGQWWVTEWTVPGCSVLDTQALLPEHIRSLLFEYQRPSAAQLLDGLTKRQFMADLSDAGTGKTPVSCAVGAARGKPISVVCAKYARKQWEWMARHFNCTVQGIHHWEIVRMGKTDLGQFVTEKVQLKTKEKEIQVFRWNPEIRKTNGLLIIDEIHNCGGIDTLNSLMAIHTRRSGIATLGLSATAADTPARMQALAYLFRFIHDPGYFYAWAHRHNVKKGKYGLSFGNPTDPDVHAMRARTMKDLHHQIFSNGLAVRIRKADIPGFPQNQVVVDGIDCGGAETKIEAEYQTIAHTLELMAARAIKASDAKQRISHARQTIELLKIPTTVEIVKDLIDEGFQVPIFVQYRATALALGKALKVPIMIGAQAEKERYKVMADFQGTADERPDYLAVPSTYGAGSESINLQDEFGWAPRCAILFPHGRAQYIIQAANRIWRATSKSRSIQRFLYAYGTIEEKTMENMRHRMFQMDMLNDGEAIPLPYAVDTDEG